MHAGYMALIFILLWDFAKYSLNQNNFLWHMNDCGRIRVLVAEILCSILGLPKKLPSSLISF